MKDAARFSQWWSKLVPRVRVSIYSIVGEEYGDVLQDVSILAIQRFDDFDDFDEFERWCSIRARWLSLDALARRSRFVSDSKRILETTSESSNSLARIDLDSLIARLPERQQVIAIDRLKGYSSEEIANRLDITPGTVRAAWYKAKGNLIKMIGDDQHH